MEPSWSVWGPDRPALGSAPVLYLRRLHTNVCYVLEAFMFVVVLELGISAEV
jgi:hypothetical protein